MYRKKLSMTYHRSLRAVETEYYKSQNDFISVIEVEVLTLQEGSFPSLMKSRNRIASYSIERSLKPQ